MLAAARRAGASTQPAGPRVRLLLPPGFPGRYSIWGALGVDDHGELWLGVSAAGGARSGALFCFEPDKDRFERMGDARAQLHAAGAWDSEVGQARLPTAIVSPGDGWMYFASTDTEGLSADDDTPPRAGSHLWRTREDAKRWEHLAAVPEGLNATAAGPGAVWALGLWHHVLCRWDIGGRSLTRRVVGAPAGHMTKHFLVDHRGHAHVPRVTGSERLTAELVEFGPDMVERAAHPLPQYQGPQPGRARGITAAATMADGSILFATSIGFLSRLHPGRGLEHLDFLHPEGPAYVTSLFALGPDRVAALVRPRDRPRHWDWVTLDLATGARDSSPFETFIKPTPVLTGSNVRDRQGRFYVAGRRHVGDDHLPVLIQITV